MYVYCTYHIRTRQSQIITIVLAFSIFHPYNKRMKKPTKNRRGAPKKPDAVRKDARLELRMSELEKQAFSEAADLAGMPLAVWMRTRLRMIARSELEQENRPVQFL